MENTNISYQFKFRSEIDPKVREIIDAYFKPDVLYHDITKRDVTKVPHVDIYVTGFPCQPFSTAGKQQGFEDEQSRGTIIFHVLKYIRKHKPKIFILENVEGITTLKQGEYLDTIMRELYQISQ